MFQIIREAVKEVELKRKLINTYYDSRTPPNVFFDSLQADIDRCKALDPALRPRDVIVWLLNSMSSPSGYSEITQTIARSLLESNSTLTDEHVSWVKDQYMERYDTLQAEEIRKRSGPEYTAPVSMQGGPWVYDLEGDPTVLCILIEQSWAYSSIFGTCPYSLHSEAVERIDARLHAYLNEWARLEKPNAIIAPDPSDEEFDFHQEPNTMRPEEDLERFVKWMMKGHSLIRLIHKRLREALPEWEKHGISKLRICWFPPAFTDPAEEGWSRRFWLPLHGPYLEHERMTVQSDEVPIEETTIHKVMRVHYPLILDDLSNYELPVSLME
ncbi:hypothetical protein BJ508DRAFT_328062 [Ascobolus immersus RN42]|uniref:Uncharacterized protein n=1 Tax=Ascobolus immersus RN42 TaxID=1160509 RepID=A0A3N4I2G2_ASCIM|nr:hypothetical protein BJ508DRAFT_328062 [Ascobolus immersus RN42]